MIPKRLKKLYFIGFLMLVSLIIAALIIYALNQNINLFYTPTQIAAREAPFQTRIRVGGMVEQGSLLRKEGVALEFVVTDYKEKLKIQYSGILPDLFREGQGVVALGRLTSNQVFVAEQILAKHDENYMPPEVAHSLKREAKVSTHDKTKNTRE